MAESTDMDLETKIKEIEEQIKTTEQTIEEVGQEIKAARKLGKSTEVALLQEEKNHLRAEKSQLRAERLICLQKQQQLQAGPALPMERFVNLLRDGGINRPDARALDYIQRRLSSRVLTCSSVEAALDLLRDGEAYPGSSTAAILVANHNVQLNGPFSMEVSACIVSGTDDDRPCIIKLLPSQPGAVSAHVLNPSEEPQPLPAEAVACNRLGLHMAQEQGVPLVQARVIQVALSRDHARMSKHGPGQYSALVMPRYTCTLADLPKLSEATILAGARRMHQALEYIHSKGLVHMDVKGANIFVDYEGLWYLGDFGSAVDSGSPIISYTKFFHKDPLERQPARKEYDWYMLAVALAVELKKEVWKESLIDPRTQRVCNSKLIAALAAVTSQDLRGLLHEIVQRGGHVG